MRSALRLAACLACASASHYETLGVQPNADPQALRQAYRALALRCHPDKVPASKKKAAASAFEAVNEAFSILSEPSSRAAYDLSLRRSAHQGQQQHSQSWQHGSRPAMQWTVACTLRELAGWQAVPMRAALAAAGMPLNIALRLDVPAWLSLPAGSREGDSVRLPLPTGIDLVLHLSVLADRRFTRREDDLHASVWLHSWHNVRKPAVRLQTLCGRRLELHRRGVEVEDGDVCTLAGFGMPRRSSSVRGDLVVRLQLRSLRASLLHLGVRVGGAGVGCALLLGALREDFRAAAAARRSDSGEAVGEHGHKPRARRGALLQRSVALLAPALGQGLKFAMGL